ncbi:cytochrome P450 [Actinoplanes sp. NPDC051494]|uniref:cytochrome P450 n=1 Tax=Actinoplanes sp. NPDC051494 TaxID=3363907 RepID=UPI0037BDD713
MAGDRPPGPRGHWLRGNTPGYEADRLGFLRRAHAEYGDVFSFDARTVCVIDPVLAHEALVRTGDTFVTELAPHQSDRDIDRVAARAVAWMAARRTAWPGLGRTAAAAADALTTTTLDQILTSAADHEADVPALMYEHSARAIAGYCFGPEAAGVPELLAENLTAVEGSRRRFAAVHARTIAELTRLVTRRRERGGGADLLGFLLEAGMTDRTVVPTLRSILLGGHGVPGAALTSVVRELALRPELVAGLRAAPDPLPLAEAVAREVLRLYPPAWLMTRTARTATTLGRWSLRTGDEVLLNAYLIHRDPRWWPDPDTFDPGRWSPGRPLPPARAFLPFGAGPRVCLGAALTLRQLALATAHLARHWSIDSPNAASAPLQVSGRLSPEGLRARFSPAPG